MGKELTEKQKAFVVEYLVDMNATRAYKAAGYSVKSENAAAVEGFKLLRNPKIDKAIQKAIEKRQERTEIKSDDVLKKLYNTAYGDIRDFVEWGEREEVVDHTPEGTPVIQFTPYLRIKDMQEVDGTQIAEIKMGKYGLEFKRSDPQKAVELLGRHLKLFTDKVESEVSGNIKVNFNIPRPPKKD